LKKQDIHHEGEFFIGARLAAKRAKLGIPIEKAAKDNRLSLDRLRALETDDFSGFAHPTYARLFLLDYATYLRVPHEDIREYLPGSKGLGHDDNNYLNVLIANNGFLKGEQFKSARRLIFAGGAAVAVLLLIVIGIYSWRTWKKFERVKPPVRPTVVATPTPARPVLVAKPTPKPTPAATPYRMTPHAPPEQVDVVTEFSLPPTPSPTVTPTPFTTMEPFRPAPRSAITPQRP
jgi:cytoskeleton protein RodZ